MRQKILLIDDSKQIHQQVSEMLAGEPVVIEWACDGNAGLDRTVMTRPDLVLLAVELPELDGFEICRRILANPVTAGLPVIFLTDQSGTEEVVRGLNMGAIDFLTKPIKGPELVSRVRAGLRTSRVIRLLEETVVRNLEEQAKQAIQVIEERYGMLARVSPVGILHFGPTGQCLDVNEKWCAVSGLDSKRAAGEGWTGTLHPDDREQVLATWCEAVRNHTAANQEYRFRHPNGTITWVINQTVPEMSEDGKLRGFVSIVTDITLQKTVEAALRDSEETGRRICQELERTNAKYAELCKTAQRFVEDVSHEFRTPLTVVKGYAEAMADGLAGPITGEQKEFLGYVMDRTRDLAQMVDDLLDSSKLRAGNMRVDRKRHRVEEIVFHARSIITAKVAANQIDVIEDLAPDLPEIYADVEKSARVLVNFAVNAIKFSPAGGRITIWARSTEDGGAEIGVTDQGPGISLENQNLLFERFRQVGESHNAANKGFGLGLSIAHDLVALNLGQIRVVSSPGQGSTFSFTLPPNNPHVVLRRYMDYLHLLPKCVGTIGLLSVECRARDGIGECIRDFLSVSLQPTDLVLDGPRKNSFRLVGLTNNLGGWVERMKKAASKFSLRRDAAIALDPIQIDVLGAWPWPNEQNQAITRIIEEFSEGELVHAADHCNYR
jgi:PAS domain S-box-containing protein